MKIVLSKKKKFFWQEPMHSLGYPGGNNVSFTMHTEDAKMAIKSQQNFKEFLLKFFKFSLYFFYSISPPPPLKKIRNKI